MIVNTINGRFAFYPKDVISIEENKEIQPAIDMFYCSITIVKDGTCVIAYCTDKFDTVMDSMKGKCTIYQDDIT